MSIVSGYAALLGLFFALLSFRALGLRRKFKVSVGTGNIPELEKAVRAHANFSEYTPLALILLLSLEFAGASLWLIHFLCAALVIGRCIHAYGISQVSEDMRFRVSGMIITLSVIIFASLRLFWSVFQG